MFCFFVFLLLPSFSTHFLKTFTISSQSFSVVIVITVNILVIVLCIPVHHTFLIRSIAVSHPFIMVILAWSHNPCSVTFKPSFLSDIINSFSVSSCGVSFFVGYFTLKITFYDSCTHFLRPPSSLNFLVTSGPALHTHRVQGRGTLTQSTSSIYVIILISVLTYFIHY